MLRRDGVCWHASLTFVALVLPAVALRFVSASGAETAEQKTASKIEIGGNAAVDVVDEDGKPIEGCTLIGIGLRSHQDPGTGYGWVVENHGPHSVAVTDADGQAELAWPRWVERTHEVTTAKISVMADHPDFCLVGHQDVDVAAGARTKVTLKRGGRLRLHAFRPGEKKPLTDFRAQISGYYDSLRTWQDVVGGPAGRMSPAMESGPRLIRLIQPEEEGALLFSDLLRFESKAGVVEDRLLKLKPAMTVRGRLSSHVPRPVRNGFVVAVVADQIAKDEYQAESLDWQTWRPIDENGIFEVNMLPPSDKVRLLAFCDGYVSVQPRKEQLPQHLKRFGDGIGSFSLPQFFDLAARSDAELTVEMEQAATCRLKVLDEDGKPIEGVSAGLFPNVVYSSGSTIFGTSFRSEDAMFEPRMTILDMLKKWQNYFPQEEREEASPILQPTFYSKSDADGVVVIENLPPRSPQGLFAQHEEYVPAGTRPPYRLQQQVELKPGETSEATIRMVPKPQGESE